MPARPPKYLRRLAVAVTALVIACWSLPVRAGDPYLEWYTLSTPHFRIHYHSGLDQIAQETANLVESVHTRLAPRLGWQPRELTHILLSDDTDSANGSATALPYNQVRLFVSAPDDMSPLGDYDGWLNELVTHEYTHILHVDNMHGIPVLLNALLGKTYAPNQAQPRWILEGLAVAMESAHTGGGRLRSTQFDMYLRADVLEDRVAPLDQISNVTRRWPSGNLWYLYGGKFIEWINDVYGPDTYAAVATDYGQNPIPWGINRSIRRVTGRTYVELYEGWKHHLRERYGKQVGELSRRGLREGRRITRHGRVAAYPRWLPRHCTSDGRDRVLYYRDDGHGTPGFYRLSPDGPEDVELVARASGRVASFEPDCSFIFESVAPSRRRYYFSDLFRQPAGTRSPRGLRGSRQRLTTGGRAHDPAVSSDGRKIAYRTNSRGTSTLRIAELTADHRLVRERRLVPSARYEQVYSPRWSPDGRKLAYSVWTQGGYRDIRIVDVASGRFIELMHDRALDQQPSWTPDGRTLLFVSDRTGIANVYAYDVASGRLSQVTNVRTGAYMPELSSDGRRLLYVGYTSDGFDLFEMPFDPARFLEALPNTVERPIVLAEYPPQNWPVEKYNPLETLRPHNFGVAYGPSVFGDGVRLTTNGSDMARHHAFAAAFAIDFDRAEPQATFDYVYLRLPFDFRATVFHSAAPRRARYGEQQQVLTERLSGATTGVSYAELGAYDAQVLSLSYTAARFETTQPLPAGVDPFSTASRGVDHGLLGIARLGYAYGNTEAYEYSISAERGFNLVAGIDHASDVTGSEDTLTAVSGRITGYVPMPWLRHHVLALAASGGTSMGTYPRRGLFYTGGFLDQGLIDSFTSSVRQGAFVLRGYEPAQFAGNQFNLFNAEYRFPIVYVDRGLSTLPAFLRSLSGAVFADYGGAFDRIDPDDVLGQYHLGVGGELWIDFLLGYYANAVVRLGVAKGFSDEAPSLQTYSVVAAGF